MTRLEVVVGAQFGSEAKGHVVQRLTENAVRVGTTPHVTRVAGPNAGHTGYDATGKPWALRQVPVAAVVDGSVVLGIAAGSEIDLPVLTKEIRDLRAAGLMNNKMLWISGEATMINQTHKSQETGSVAHTSDPFALDINMIERIGSTGKGIGAARADRIWRTPGIRLRDNANAMGVLGDLGVAIGLEPHINPHMGAEHVIVEGTQGYGLGLRAGYYPQCTSSDCRAIDFLAMAGIDPTGFDTYQVWAVARVFPIRVAGNSGPLLGETTWEELGLPEERTTVTKKVRRVGSPDWALVRRAVEANGGPDRVCLALTMVDQMFPATANHPYTAMAKEKYDQVVQFIRGVEQETGADVRMVTTGPNTAVFR